MLGRSGGKGIGMGYGLGGKKRRRARSFALHLVAPQLIVVMLRVVRVLTECFLAHCRSAPDCGACQRAHAGR